MRGGKRVFEVGRVRVAVMYGGRYRFGFNVKRLLGRPVGFTAGLGVCVVSTLVRAKREARDA